MAKGLKAVCGAAALGMGLLGAAGAARADTFDFFFQSVTGYNINSTGQFVLTNSPRVGYYNSSSTGTYNTNNSSQNYMLGAGAGAVSPSGATSLSQITYLGLGFGNNSGPISVFSIGGPVTYSSGTFTGTFDDSVKISSGATSGGTGLFTATLENFLNPISPGSGGGSTGSGSGGSGGGSSASGGAPSPEVNTLLGFLVVGGVVAFMKRGRRDEDEAEG